MANKAMMTRHWDRIAQLTGFKFEVEADNFLLRNIMEAPLLKNKEDIEVFLKNLENDKHSIACCLSCTYINVH